MPPLRLYRHFVFLPLQLDDLKHFAHFLAQDFRDPLPCFAQRERDIFRHRHGIEKRRALKKNADFLPDSGELTLAQSDDILAIDTDFSRVRLHQADEMLEQNALAAAASADDRERLAAARRRGRLRAKFPASRCS